MIDFGKPVVVGCVLLVDVATCVVTRRNRASFHIPVNYYQGHSGVLHRVRYERVLGVQKVGTGVRVRPRMPAEDGGVDERAGPRVP